MGKVIGGAAGMLVVVLIFFFIRAIIGITIDSSHVGVVSNWGHIDRNQTPLGPGYNTVNPLGGYSIISVDTRPQSFQFSEVKSNGSDGQAIYYDVTVNYEINPNQAATLVIKGGPDDPADHLLKTIVTPNIQSELRILSPAYSIIPGARNAQGQDIYILNHRPELAAALDKALSGTVDQWGITILPNGINLTNVHPDPSFERAIEATALSQQALQKANADAAATVAKAQGDAQANALKQQQLAQQQVDINSLYAQAALEAAKRWDGKLPATYAGGTLPFINVAPTPHS